MTGPEEERWARIVAEARGDIDALLRLYGYPSREPGQPLPRALAEGGAGWLLGAILHAAARRVDVREAPVPAVEPEQ